MKKIVISLVFLALGWSAKAQQDPQYTMYMFNQLALNPAYAGSRGCLSATAHYRTQWVGVDGAPKTLSFGIHSPLKREHVALGLQVINDQIGVTNTTNIVGSYAYRIALNKKAKLSIGLQAVVTNYKNQLSSVTTSIVNDQSFRLNESLLLPNFGAGLYYNTENTYIGLTIPHLINNNLESKSSNVISAAQAKQFRHLFVMAGTVIPINDFIKLKPSGIFKFAPNSPIEVDGNVSALFYDALWFGVSWRSDVSTVRAKLTESLDFILIYELNKRTRIGVAYDQTLTDIRTVQKGSYEFLVGYDFIKEPLKMLTPRYF
jgi:type IX secretion system PorP/SprF family membrane protein